MHELPRRDQVAQNPKLQPVRDSWQTGKPIEWVRIHRVPDYAYFNHSAHVNRGVSCVSCHGQINQMEVVWQDQPLGMAFCLECHRAREKKFLRPLSEITHLDWKPEDMGTNPETGKTLHPVGNRHQTQARLERQARRSPARHRCHR